MDPRVQAKDIPVGADVECADGLCGACTAVVVEPHSETVTHLVVREQEFPHLERLVPLSRVTRSHPSRIILDCRLAEFRQMPEFVETEYLPGSMPYFFWPVGLEGFTPLVIEHERVPTGELAIHRGARVQAADGPAGRVEEFLVDGAGRITHLVVREGHLWGLKDVTVPVSAISRLEEDTVYLRIDRRSLAALPAAPAGHRPKHPLAGASGSDAPDR